jgi:hypothetical protein
MQNPDSTAGVSRREFVTTAGGAAVGAVLAGSGVGGAPPPPPPPPRRGYGRHPGARLQSKIGLLDVRALLERLA